MSKAHLIKKISAQTGESQQKVNEFLKAFVENVQGIVSEGEQVTLIGFGTFYKAYRKATEGRNPQTGEKIQIKAAELPKFRAGKKFKEVVGN